MNTATIIKLFALWLNEGNADSGNHGHSGRPGKVGGSERDGAPARIPNAEIIKPTTYSGNGIVFETGKPVKFTYIRNTVPAPKIQGDPYDQKIEPSGRFMLQKTFEGSAGSGWEEGSIEFTSPLVIEHVATKGADGWKQRLSSAYKGKTGKALSKAIAADGYDGIVTVEKDGTSEIVDLTNLR